MKINCLPDGRVVDAEPGETILFADLRANIPHAHACGGKGKCTTCRIAVVEGLENCPPRNELEASAAVKLGFAPEIRLACQTRPNGEVTFRRLVLDDKDREIASQLARKRTGPVGESNRIAVLFSDIRGFTALSQTLSPYDVMFALNRHFAELGEIIERNGGYIDNFIGDALMALFGVDGDRRAPFRSVKAAVEMLEANERMAPHMEATYGHAFPIGIGVHFGEAVIGTLGSSSNARLTAVGDTVNVASRIEAANKQAGTRLLISSELYEMVKDDVIMEDFIRVKLPGTQERMSLHEISGINPEALERDRAEQGADRSRQRYAGKIWTAVMNGADLPANGRRLIELEAFDLLVIRSGECPQQRLPPSALSLERRGRDGWGPAGVQISPKLLRPPHWRNSGVVPRNFDPDGTMKAPALKFLGNVSKNRAPLAVFPVRISDGKIWAALE